MTALGVAVAGAVGVLARYLISAPLGEGALLWTTAAINILGSFLLGLLAASAVGGEGLRAVLGVGFLGGFTTFSAFSVQTLDQLQADRPGRALAYVAISVALGVGAAAVGWYVARS